MEELPCCIICHDTNNKLVKITVCCPIIVHEKCLSDYFNTKKKCMICSTNLSNKIKNKSTFSLNFLKTCNSLLWFLIITTYCIAFNRVNTSRCFTNTKLGILSIITFIPFGPILVTSFITFIYITYLCFTNNLTLADFINTLIKKHEEYYYLFVTYKTNNPSKYQHLFYEPYRLFKSESSSIKFTVFILYFTPLICITISNCLIIGFYSEQFIPSLYLISMIPALLIILLYFMVLPILFSICIFSHKLILNYHNFGNYIYKSPCTITSYLCCTKKDTLNVDLEHIETI